MRERENKRKERKERKKVKEGQEEKKQKVKRDCTRKGGCLGDNERIARKRE